ncbi:MAG: hypothetical protein NUW21_04915 [Elusimicrobia bacterium]|nr:hypothetical protein [Elusimicrobiota bacterium]
MQVTSITVTYGRKLNLGNYSNANLEITIAANLDDDDTLDGVGAELWRVAKEQIRTQALPLLKQQDAG